MGAPDLLEHLKSLGLNVTIEGGEVWAGPKAALTDDVRDLIRKHRTELIEVCAADDQVEARRKRVISMLEQNPVIRYALTADAESDPDEVIVTLAIRDFAECELRILQDKYDAFLLLRLIEDTGGPFTRVKDMT